MLARLARGAGVGPDGAWRDGSPGLALPELVQVWRRGHSHSRRFTIVKCYLVTFYYSKLILSLKKGY